MDDMRKSFSKLKKDFKHRLGSKKRAPDTEGTNAAGEGVSSSPPLLRPDHHAAVSGHDGEGTRVSVDVSQAHSRDPSPHPELVPADEGRLDDPQSEEVDVDERKVSRRHSSLVPGVGGAAGSSPTREIKRASSLPSVTPIPPKQELDGMWTLSLQLLCLTVHLDNAGAPDVPDHVPQDPIPDENIEPSAAANEKKSSWKSTAIATAKLLLRGVRDSADAFGPLKSVAGGLCFILENCEVSSSSYIYYHNSDQYPSE